MVPGIVIQAAAGSGIRLSPPGEIACWSTVLSAASRGTSATLYGMLSVVAMFAMIMNAVNAAAAAVIASEAANAFFIPALLGKRTPKNRGPRAGG